MCVIAQENKMMKNNNVWIYDVSMSVAQTKELKKHNWQING